MMTVSGRMKSAEFEKTKPSTMNDLDFRRSNGFVRGEYIGIDTNLFRDFFLFPLHTILVLPVSQKVQLNAFTALSIP
jgi:hypothetical protein